MTKHSLTIAELKIIEAEDEDRCFLLSAGLFGTAVVAYVRIGDVGDADAILSSAGITALSMKVPAGRPVYAWTDAGTAELCTAKRT